MRVGQSVLFAGVHPYALLECPGGGVEFVVRETRVDGEEGEDEEGGC